MSAKLGGIFQCLLFIASFYVAYLAPLLPLCSKTGDTYGRWVNINHPLKPDITVEEVQPYFINGGPKFAVNFTQIWLPYNCSYHRFTNNTIKQCINKLRQRTSHPFRLTFVGDSATRSLYCGLTRVLSGHEFYGPCDNNVCGTAQRWAPISYRQSLQLFHEDFGHNVTLSFMYFKTYFPGRGTEPALANAMGLKSYAFITNTGAWDFDHISRVRGKWMEQCDGNDTQSVADARASPPVIEIFHKLAKEAKKYHTRLIYRTNHYNNRFGVHCADDKVIAALSKMHHWEIWDNRNVSRDCWQEQDIDGFHFDRTKVHSFDHHVGHMKYFYDHKWHAPGQLEQQLTQSLLHFLFHDCVQEMYNEEVKIRNNL